MVTSSTTHSSYQVKLTNKAAKELERIKQGDKILYKRIVGRLLSLGDDPHVAGAEKLQGEDGYRVRVGNYRILYTIDNVTVVVEVFRVAHRREVYRGL